LLSLASVTGVADMSDELCLASPQVMVASETSVVGCAYDPMNQILANPLLGR
jgi:hypothetical protein